MTSRILIVEDERLVASDLERMLVRNGFQVAGIVSSAEMALEQVGKQKPDLVLMDIVLEGAMDGITAAGLIRADYDIPVLFLSAHSDTETLERAKVAGSSGYILKPVRERELYVSMEMALYKKDMECRLQQSEERQEALGQLFENFNEGIILVGVDGIIRRVNAGFERLFLYSKEEAEGRTVDALIIPPGQRSRFEEMFSDCSRKSLGSFETARMRKDGEVIDVSIWMLPVLRAGKAVSLYIIYRDVSEQARLQRAVLRTQRLDSIGILAGGIAHDFNNIVAAVLGNISLARTYSRENSYVSELLGRAEQAAVRARDLTGRLLDFSRGRDVEPAAMCLSDLLRETLDLALSGSNVLGRLDVEPDLYPVVGDEGHFTQIFNNLIINAKQAMPDGGSVTVTARNRDDLNPHMVESEFFPGRYVQVMVCDNGPGIDDCDLGRVFDPYFTTKETGTGLGLATVHFLVRQYNGMVTVDSHPGKGTCFTLYFPASLEEPESGDLSAGKMIAGEGRILVMDDESALLEVLTEILERLGYEAGRALNGNDAVQCYREALEQGRRYDLVIMDLTVPGGMGGREAMEELLKIDPEVLGIVSSGYSHDPVMERFMDYGFCARIAKPYRIEELSRVLTECLKKR